jgi:hypothetical protein
MPPVTENICYALMRPITTRFKELHQKCVLRLGNPCLLIRVELLRQHPNTIFESPACSSAAYPHPRQFSQNQSIPVLYGPA